MAARTLKVDFPAEIFDAEKGVILIKGAVPGPKNGLVLVRTAAKAPAVKGAKGVVR